MHYTFPEIHTIDDVLPHIEGRKEFRVFERDFGSVINYTYYMKNTFRMNNNADDDENEIHGGAIRRECRGIIFDKEGNLISRPFHKFFNVNELDETKDTIMEKSIQEREHIIMEKMDGSMIRPLIINGNVCLGTKMGPTDVSNKADDWLTKQEDGQTKRKWLHSKVTNGTTPLFEWVSPANQIVLEYTQDDLVYLGSRQNMNGQYFMEDPKTIPFNTVQQYGSVRGNLREYIDEQRKVADREGDVIRFKDGHMLKVKNDWYVNTHNTSTAIGQSDYNIVKLIVNEELDDVIPKLSQYKAKYVREFEASFWAAVLCKEEDLGKMKLKINEYQGDRKRIACEFIPTLENRSDNDFAWLLNKNKTEDIRSMILKYIGERVNSEQKWKIIAKWMSFEFVEV